MKAILQRVKEGSVTVDGEIVAKIDQGLMILLGIGQEDTITLAEQMVDKIATLRIFGDQEEKMNLSIQDVGGSAIVVSQFTLFADTRKGRRPSFVNAARPDLAEPLVNAFAAMMNDRGIPTQTGIFGAHMDVALVNDGPVTIILEFV
ncbi:MAG: D-aminoacyl-tRNA deacylase [Brevefilum sp.]|jgi:D-tyrosyl-tRNA(Tyr) deacylase